MALLVVLTEYTPMVWRMTSYFARIFWEMRREIRSSSATVRVSRTSMWMEPRYLSGP